MTGGTALRSAAEILGGASGAQALRLVIVAGGLAQLTAAGLFVLNMWRRVRMPMVATPQGH